MSNKMNLSDEGTRNDALKRLASYDLEFLRMPISNRAAAPAKFDETIFELRRFFALMIHQNEPLAVTDPDVDDLWHSFVLRTKRYRAFCDDIFGEFIDHQPHSLDDPVPAAAIGNTIKSYRKAFGAVPRTWFADPNLISVASNDDNFPLELQYQWSGWPGRTVERRC